MSTIKVNKIENTNTTSNGISINNSGQVTVPSITGNVSMASGNLSFASGQGIDFSADSNASGMTSELLDDYEEGTWTPSFDYITNGVWYGATYDTAPGITTGYYTKIGNTVYFWYYSSTVDISSGVGYAGRISGLPYTSANNYYSISFAHTTLYSTNVSGGYVQPNDSYLFPIQDGSVNAGQYADGNRFVMVHGSYQTA